MLSVYAHELSETVTDPNRPYAWADMNGEENADACNAYFPGILPSSPPYYNLYGVDGTKFLIQGNLNPWTIKCEITGNATMADQCVGLKDGLSCSCAAGESTLDGCLCSKDQCVPFCRIRVGRRCRGCSRRRCFCQGGTCTARS